MCGRSFASPDRKLKGGNRFQKANAHRTYRTRPASFAIRQRCTQGWMYGGITTKEPLFSCCSPGLPYLSAHGIGFLQNRLNGKESLGVEYPRFSPA
jgi:hypothetical protein